MSEAKNIYKYEGTDADVTWDSRLCIHVGECGRSDGSLFEGGRDPWCQPDHAAEGKLLPVIQRCPSGALSVMSKQGVPIEEPSTEPNTVVVTNDGPLYVRGRLEIDGAPKNMRSVIHRAALCRCGQSNNKPFCDNSHRETGFQDAGAVGSEGETVDLTTDEPLVIKRAKNGPYLLSGPFRIVAGSGRIAWQGKKAALCRCGHSSNKPFCDGTHAKVGFQAE